eukprot:CAMPEP_0182581408 /NCGR_PEP_ID=MMETSP1324-20130603/49883_1 /TAXON_ID=236786 /ORGANISM="Florenciella sp., Strain RCC1587" /LENGTH=90 /DNA_ID=CAMNT_0024797763 /DNA_START=91 /DNA_END=363 /DNA_ORIENTATION=-
MPSLMKTAAVALVSLSVASAWMPSTPRVHRMAPAYGSQRGEPLDIDALAPGDMEEPCVVGDEMECKQEKKSRSKHSLKSVSKSGRLSLFD